MIPGKRIGSTTSRSVCHGLAPRSRAASSYARLNRLNTANMINSPNGSVQVSCAPSAEENQAGETCANWNIRPTPSPSSSPGMMRLAMAI